MNNGYHMGKIHIEFMKQIPIIIPETGYIAGATNIQKESTELDFEQRILEYMSLEDFKDMGEGDNAHYPMGKAPFKYGISGIIERAKTRCALKEEDNSFCMEAVIEVYEAVREYIQKHYLLVENMLKENCDKEDEKRLSCIRDNCYRLIRQKPHSFEEAVQLFWFIYRIRTVMGVGAIGRLDQLLHPFYAQDIDSKKLTKEKALELLVELFYKFDNSGSGDTLRNLMLSGSNEQGIDETNELTYLFLEAAIQTKVAEPHLNVRIHEKTPQALMDKIVELMYIGTGQPTLYFDNQIIPNLIEVGISPQFAYNYANDGCTEVVIQDYAGIRFWQLEAMKTLELTLFNGEENPSIGKEFTGKWKRNSKQFIPHTGLKLGYKSGKVTQCQNYEEFFELFTNQLKYQMNECLKEIDKKIVEDKTISSTAPFIAGTFEKCLETGKDPLRGGGFEIPCYQYLSGTLTTVADALLAVKRAVFEDKKYTMKEVIDALSNDFNGYEEMCQYLKSLPKFGNDINEVDNIAAQLVELFCQMVTNYQTQENIKIWPGIYNIDFKMFAYVVGATPDGRKWKDPIAEHYSPTPNCAKKGPTAVINSASKARLDLGVASSPVHLTMQKIIGLQDKDMKKILQTLVKVASKTTIPVFNIGMYDIEELRDAQINPHRHKELIVRVWGYNAYFVDLEKDLQNHIIGRLCDVNG